MDDKISLGKNTISLHTPFTKWFARSSRTNPVPILNNITPHDHIVLSTSLLGKANNSFSWGSYHFAQVSLPLPPMGVLDPYRSILFTRLANLGSLNHPPRPYALPLLSPMASFSLSPLVFFLSFSLHSIVLFIWALLRSRATPYANSGLEFRLRPIVRGTEFSPLFLALHTPWSNACSLLSGDTKTLHCSVSRFDRGEFSKPKPKFPICSPRENNIFRTLVIHPCVSC